MKKNAFYVLLFVACGIGYLWVFLISNTHLIQGYSPNVCIIKSLTNVPCPSCGSSRAVVSLLKGNIVSSIMLNPFGLLVFSIMTISPIWILTDMLLKKSTLFDFYNYLEKKVKNRKIAIVLIIFVLLNWVWNIAKGL